MTFAEREQVREVSGVMEDLRDFMGLVDLVEVLELEAVLDHISTK